MSKNKEVVKKKENEVVVHNDYGSMGGEGFEGITNQDLSIPFISILQPLSEIVVNEQIEGVKAGMLYNTVTKEVMDGAAGITFIPCYKDKSFVEWIPQNKGGGFVGLHAPDSEIVTAAIAANGSRYGKIVLENENELVETHYVYGLILNKEGTETEGFAVINFSSSKIKPCMNWFTSMFTLKGKPPLFANRAVLKTIKQKNDSGTWFNYSIDPLKATWKESLIDPVNEINLLKEAQDFRQMITSGKATAAYASQDNADTVSPSGDAPF